MSLSSEEVRASIAFAEGTGLLDVPERIRTLASRIDGHATAVAVVGMVKRGKSTLFNRLVGAEVSAVSATPETAATIQVMSGSPAAWGRTQDGSVVTLPSQPEKFMERLRRRNEDRIVSAGITGNFRIPTGLVLIDTPGVGDVATALEDDLASLDAQWMDAGAGAALVVLSAQTQDSKDRALIEKAQRAFPGAVEVVVKPTSRDLTNDEVIEVSEFIENQIGVRVMPMFDVTPSAVWGTDEVFAPLEALLVELSKRAEGRLDVDVQRFEAFIDELCTELRTADLIELPALMSYPLTAELPPSLQSTLDATIQRLESEKKLQDEVALRESNATRAADAELRAQSLIRLYETTAEDWTERISIIEQLVACSSDGSQRSAEWLERLIVAPTWPSGGFSQRRRFLVAAISGVARPRVDSVIQRAPLTDGDIDRLLHGNLESWLRDPLENVVASRVTNTPSEKIQSIAAAIQNTERKKELQALADAALEKEQESAVRVAISRIQKFSVAELKASRMSLLNSISASEKVLRSSRALSALTRTSLEHAEQQAITTAWDRLGAAHIGTIHAWFETYPSDKQQADSRLTEILDESDIVVEKISGTATGAQLEVIRKVARTAGPAWTAQIRSKVNVAKAAVKRQESQLRSTHSVALLGTLLFAFACRRSPMFALASIISFTIACIASAAMGSIGSWQSRVPSISIPDAIATLGANPPKRLKLPPLEDDPPNPGKRSGGCQLTMIAVICAIIALVSSIAYSTDRANSQSASRPSLYSRGSSGPARNQQTIPANPTTSVPRTSSTTSSSSSSSSSSSTSTTKTSTSTTRMARNSLAELSTDYSYQPDKCGIDASIRSYPHSPSRTYEVTATIGLWRAPTTSSSRVGIIDVSEYGPGGIGCASGYGPEVTVSCQVEGEPITGPFGTDTTWLKVRINGYTGYVTDQWVDTQWDVFTNTIQSCS